MEEESHSVSFFWIGKNMRSRWHYCEGYKEGKEKTITAFTTEQEGRKKSILVVWALG